MSHDSLSLLNDHQTEVLDIIQRVEAMLTEPHDVAGLARARWALVRALGSYQIFKHHDVFDPLIARASPTEVTHLLQMRQACLALGADFHEHVKKWSGSDVEAEWSAYRRATLAMMAQIRTHIARERAGIEPVLTKAAGATITPPPAGAPRRPDRPTPAG